MSTLRLQASAQGQVAAAPGPQDTSGVVRHLRNPARAHLPTLPTLLLGLALLPAPGLAAYDCVIEPSRTVELGSPVVGVLEQILVDRGDRVSRNQVVAQLSASVERAALATAQSRADAVSADAESSRAAGDYAARKSERSTHLFEQNYVSAQSRDQDATEASLAQLRARQADRQLRTARDDVELARARLAERTIRSPVQGVVMERFLEVGERVEEKPLLRIATTDPLRVDLVVPANDYNLFQVGRKAEVVPEGVFQKTLTATVTQVDRVLDAASNTFRVRLRLPNPGDRLPAGLRCKLSLPGQAAATPAGGAAAPASGQVEAQPPASEKGRSSRQPDRRSSPPAGSSGHRPS